MVKKAKKSSRKHKKCQCAHAINTSGGALPILPILGGVAALSTIKPVSKIDNFVQQKFGKDIKKIPVLGTIIDGIEKLGFGQEGGYTLQKRPFDQIAPVFIEGRRPLQMGRGATLKKSLELYKPGVGQMSVK